MPPSSGSVLQGSWYAYASVDGSRRAARPRGPPAAAGGQSVHGGRDGGVAGGGGRKSRRRPQKRRYGTCTTGFTAFWHVRVVPAA